MSTDKKLEQSFTVTEYSTRVQDDDDDECINYSYEVKGDAIKACAFETIVDRARRSGCTHVKFIEGGCVFYKKD